jgi:putative transposase
MYRISLTEEQRHALKQQTRQREIAGSTRDRLEMVRLSDAGWSVPRIARHLDWHEQTVRTCIRAFLEGGWNALENKLRGGKSSALTPEMVAAAREEVAKGQRVWSSGQIADWLAARYQVRLSERRVREHLRQTALLVPSVRSHLPQPPTQAKAHRSRDYSGHLRDAAKGGDHGLMDLAHLDEVGFAMTLPTSYSWFVQGQRLRVAYESPQGRRVNAIGAYFTHGPQAGRLEHASWAALPPSRAKKQRNPPAQIATCHGLRLEETGPIDATRLDATRLLAFMWRVAGRPPHAPENWRRERPLMIVLDNDSVPHSQEVQDARAALEAADIFLVYLPAYAPELSAIEPVWNDVKAHHMPVRSFERVAPLKIAVDAALARKAQQLQQVRA